MDSQLEKDNQPDTLSKKKNPETHYKNSKKDMQWQPKGILKRTDVVQLLLVGDNSSLSQSEKLDIVVGLSNVLASSAKTLPTPIMITSLA
ncbi:hypothetical protein ACH5RR_009203 [Cinchona calisaya]|uniref:Uncharacterized protein n=1 Tax=Cinchona calisaya TaxID=153742 RepID=A0ABD3ADM6_9GENT